MTAKQTQEVTPGMKAILYKMEADNLKIINHSPDVSEFNGKAVKRRTFQKLVELSYVRKEFGTNRYGISEKGLRWVERSKRRV
jgi:hypothetical protein